eukprot:1523954-Rhodomonas_salina.1
MACGVWRYDATSGTEIAYDATRLDRQPSVWSYVCAYAMCGTEAAYVAAAEAEKREKWLEFLVGCPICLRAAYAMSGTDLAYGLSTRSLCHVRGGKTGRRMDGRRGREGLKARENGTVTVRGQCTEGMVLRQRCAVPGGGSTTIWTRTTS